jgi:energy-coupling factor transporter ATP-binding protein EcfA2
MKSRLQRLEIRNFKAFREFTLDLEGRHLLVYGSNGSGKSSLYWALYTFLQSARKPTSEVAKYFEPAGKENLLNIHEQSGPAPKPGEIVFTLRDTATKTDTLYRITKDNHGTRNQAAILKGDLASDFITYRFFFGFSHFRNSDRYDLWPLFEKEILPFCVSTGGQVPLDLWSRIRSGRANPTRSRGAGGTRAYQRFKGNTVAFAAILPGIIDSINAEAQKFYDAHFAADDPAKIEIKLGVTTPPDFDIPKRAFTKPEIGFAIKIGDDVINRPQVFLNEAKLTQLALSVRFAASLVNLHDSDLKLLVLDDLLVSLDMSNRMKVVEILLSDTFANYQKIILTHELGFFREFRRKLGTTHSDWCFLRLEGAPKSKIVCKSEKSNIQKAEEYLHGHNLDEAALCLRKAVETTAQRFLDRDNHVDATREFTGLRADLRTARGRILGELPVNLYEKVLRVTPAAHRGLLLPHTDDDIDGNVALDAPAKGILKTQRKHLRQLISTDHVERLRQIKLIDDILACTDRVLNPAAHAGNPPLYQKEVQDALDLIKQLDTVF